MHSLSLDSFKKRVYTLIFTIGWLANLVAWRFMEMQGVFALPIRTLFWVGMLLMPILIFLTWKPGVPSRIVDSLMVVYMACVSAACIALGFYSEHSAHVALESLYMWVPVMYMFAFSQENRQRALWHSAFLWLLLFLVSLPFLLANSDSYEALYNIQLHFMSAFFVVAFYFFATHQKHLRLAKLNVDELATLANTDELTQLANRRRLEELLSSEHLRFARYGHVYALILLDIDHFKQFNDNFGHDIGDKILQALARRIQEVLREVDTLARWGGEELVVLLPETELDEARQKAEQICRHVRDKAFVGGYTITLSCGVTEVCEGDDPSSMFKRADDALYQAKGNGRNRVEGLPIRQPASDIA